MKTIGISEFKAHCIALLKELQRTQSPLIITHRGRPLARIEPVVNSECKRLGALRDLGEIKGDLVNASFADEWDMEAS